jgi:hypothetical protein
MGEREIFLLMKWEIILDMIDVFQFTLVPSLVALRDVIAPLGATSTCIFLLGT